MELRDFISSTLVEIIHGIASAQDFSQEFPEFGSVRYTAGLVEFDVALSVEKSEGGAARIGVPVLGASAQSDSKRSAVHRVKFNVPVTVDSGFANQPLK